MRGREGQVPVACFCYGMIPMVPLDNSVFAMVQVPRIVQERLVGAIDCWHEATQLNAAVPGRTWNILLDRTLHRGDRKAQRYAQTRTEFDNLDFQPTLM